jgi:hypothetical protein
MADIEKNPAMLLDELATLDRPQRQKVTKKPQQVSDTFAEVPDGEKTRYVFGVLLHLVDPS